MPSNDLRGLLAAAKMAATLLRHPKAAISPAREKHLDVVLRNLERADRMVTDLLDVERIHAIAGGGGRAI